MIKMNFNNQFNDNPEINLSKEYWCTPLTKYKGFTKLMKLVSMGDKYLDEIKKELLINPSTINIKNTGGWTALIISARNTNTKSSNIIIKLLLEHKANVNDKDIDGWTSLMLASRNSNTDSSNETVKLLLEHKANVNDKDIAGKTALMYAYENYRTTSSEQTVKLLLECDSNIDVSNINDTATLIMLVNVTNEIIRNTVQTNIPINQSEPWGSIILSYL